VTIRSVELPQNFQFAAHKNCIVYNHLITSYWFEYHQFDTHKFYVLSTQLYLCVLCGSQIKQPLFSYITLTDRFL